MKKQKVSKGEQLNFGGSADGNKLGKKIATDVCSCAGNGTENNYTLKKTYPKKVLEPKSKSRLCGRNFSFKFRVTLYSYS